MREIEVDHTAIGMSVEQRRASLAPGARATGLVGKSVISIVGRVPATGLTRQQRRAIARGKA